MVLDPTESIDSCFENVLPFDGASGGAIGVSEALDVGVEAAVVPDLRLRAPMLPK